MRLSRPAPARVASGLGESIAGPLTSLTVIPSIPTAIHASFTSSILKGLTNASIFFINSKYRFVAALYPQVSKARFTQCNDARLGCLEVALYVWRLPT